MKPIRLVLACLVLLGLAGCYTSDAPLITEADSVAPFSRITFIPHNADGERGEPAVFTRKGEHYVTTSEGNIARLNLKPIEDNDYVAQLSGEKPDEVLYGYIRIAPETKTAEVWMSMGDRNESRPGLRPCRDSVCIDDLDAYVRYAKEAVSKDPDSVFDIIIEP